MSDGEAISFCPFYPSVIRFDDALWGTEMFWDPLLEQDIYCSFEELKAIQQIADREGISYERAKEVQDAAGVFRHNSDFTKVLYGRASLCFSPEKAILVKILCENYWASDGRVSPWMHHSSLAGEASRLHGYAYGNPRTFFRPEDACRKIGFIEMNRGSFRANLDGFRALLDADLD